MGKHYDFISKIPTTVNGQKSWIIAKAKEKVNNRALCIDALSNFELRSSIKELYNVVDDVVYDTLYWHF